MFWRAALLASGRRINYFSRYLERSCHLLGSWPFPLLYLIFRSGDYHPHGTLDHLSEVGFACMRALLSEDFQPLTEAPQSVHGLIAGLRGCVGDLPHLSWCQQIHA